MQMSFQVDGSFITDLSRQWFWQEDREYSVCEELLLNCLCGTDLSDDELKHIAQDIIEGRKKLVGTNDFDLIDDNEVIRPISKKLEETRKKMEIQRISLEMESNMLKYVDPYSTRMSLKAAKGKYRFRNFESCRLFFLCNTEDWTQSENGELIPNYAYVEEREYANKHCVGGLWLANEPELVWEASKNTSAGTDEFWENIYTLIKDREDIDFARRNQRYLSSIRIKKEKQLRYENWLPDESVNHSNSFISESKISYEEKFEKGRYLWGDELDNVVEAIAGTIEFCEKASKKYDIPIFNIAKDNCINVLLQEREIMYLLVPDNMINYEGLISPNGDFYSCDFGGHDVKAQHIIESHPDQFPELDEDTMHSMKMECGLSAYLDYIIARGWAATRYLPTRGNYLMLPEEMNPIKHTTKAQKDRIFDVITKFDVKLDLTPIGY